MCDNDPRDLENPDRLSASSQNSTPSDRTNRSEDRAARYRMALTRIDRLVSGLLASLERDDDLGDEATKRCKRHVREIRAEADAVRVLVPVEPRPENETVPMVVDRGPETVSQRGPEPDAFEQRRERSESDDGE